MATSSDSDLKWPRFNLQVPFKTVDEKKKSFETVCELLNPTGVLPLDIDVVEHNMQSFSPRVSSDPTTEFPEQLL